MPFYIRLVNISRRAFLGAFRSVGRTLHPPAAGRFAPSSPAPISRMCSLSVPRISDGRRASRPSEGARAASLAARPARQARVMSTPRAGTRARVLRVRGERRRWTSVETGARKQASCTVPDGGGVCRVDGTSLGPTTGRAARAGWQVVESNGGARRSLPASVLGSPSMRAQTRERAGVAARPARLVTHRVCWSARCRARAAALSKALVGSLSAAARGPGAICARAPARIFVSPRDRIKCCSCRGCACTARCGGRAATRRARARPPCRARLTWGVESWWGGLVRPQAGARRHAWGRVGLWEGGEEECAKRKPPRCARAPPRSAQAGRVVR